MLVAPDKRDARQATRASTSPRARLQAVLLYVPLTDSRQRLAAQEACNRSARKRAVR